MPPIFPCLWLSCLSVQVQQGLFGIVGEADSHAFFGWHAHDCRKASIWLGRFGNFLPTEWFVSSILFVTLGA